MLDVCSVWKIKAERQDVASNPGESHSFHFKGWTAVCVAQLNDHMNVFL